MHFFAFSELGWHCCLCRILRTYNNQYPRPLETLPSLFLQRSPEGILLSFLLLCHSKFNDQRMIRDLGNSCCGFPPQNLQMMITSPGEQLDTGRNSRCGFPPQNFRPLIIWEDDKLDCIEFADYHLLQVGGAIPLATWEQRRANIAQTQLRAVVQCTIRRRWSLMTRKRLVLRQNFANYLNYRNWSSQLFWSF